MLNQILLTNLSLFTLTFNPAVSLHTFSFDTLPEVSATITGCGQTILNNNFFNITTYNTKLNNYLQDPLFLKRIQLTAEQKQSRFIA